MVAAASARLVSTQHPSVIAAACDLSVETGDKALRERVQQLAQQSSSVAALGVRDPSLIGMVQRRAGRALQSR
jgi:hypothetical protein